MRRRRVLVIDDEEQVRRVLVRVLEREGYAVRAAADGVEGMMLQRAEPYDLVITDLFMPDQDGIETIQMLADEFPATPVIAISGAPEEVGTLVDARLFGAAVTLGKPLSIPELLRAIHDLMEGEGA